LGLQYSIPLGHHFQAASDAEVAIKKLEHEVQALAKEKAGHVTAVTNLEKQYEWISEESQCVRLPALIELFYKRAARRDSRLGQVGSQYDLSKLDIAQLKERTRELEDQQWGMKRKVKPEVMSMIDMYVVALFRALA
jgi:structural maintenance of chromosome 2